MKRETIYLDGRPECVIFSSSKNYFSLNNRYLLNFSKIKIVNCGEYVQDLSTEGYSLTKK